MARFQMAATLGDPGYSKRYPSDIKRVPSPRWNALHYSQFDSHRLPFLLSILHNLARQLMRLTLGRKMYVRNTRRF
ncbi:hypothetical protein Pla52o_48180 [Novipirellula galeiformis]|uniref:Uncharacterized protein n=1 Tax=Novipirellula galeiformis TaxID=2528004 RepID=A0A5C6CBU7_9BACT|nr:hypothetical protein [Novipirellula galeiformis]TWU20299.1 hypothetical protein Pla52o_48180 [Novipirellula galeiformis]